ncbi:hypothetical protein [Siphonobacter sp. SORGH_AS_1065]|uniref:hypothetical protein n=1 Tax=Siphonobacter sp. SORGH_AS_1065 TaxID=3041795 RepID=UPI002786A593|nr:hypothetical protein [Siphonobacter sp. SORGH_AS_1065]MDQ1085730.1 hypothetical protein [Siphonobacter sp. SORGH_AS_1065]
MKRLLLVIFCLYASSVWAQMLPSKRLEILRDDKLTDDFEVLPLGSQGVLVTKILDNPSRGINHTYQFSRYDSTLALRWESEFKLKPPYKALLSYHTPEHLFWLCGDPDSDKIQIWKTSLDTGEMEVIEGEVPAIDIVSKFKILGNKAFLGGTYNDRPVVVSFSFFDKTSQALPELFDFHLTINDLDVDEKGNKIHVFSKYNRRGKCLLQMYTYAYDGHLLSKTTLNDESDRSLITAKIVHLENGESLLVGNYSLNCSDYSQGLYLTKVTDQPQNKIQYVPFSDLQNFFNYLKPSRQERMRNKIAAQKKLGKDLKFHYLLHIQDLIPTEEGYLMVAEAYFPQTKTSSSFTPTAVTNRRLQNSYESFRYTHALVCGLNRSGELVWDNSMELKDLTSDLLSPQVQLSTLSSNTLCLSYTYESKVRALQIQKDKTLGKIEEYELLPAELNKSIDRDPYPSLISWYGPYYLSWGFRKYPPAANQSSKEAFFLYKLEHPVH